MEPSCIDESTTSDSAATSAAGSPVPSSKSPPGSIVLDGESGGEAESRKLPSSKYKGVVPQPNGRWGAQIYEKHQRVWLGTFNEEHEAARAYDIAAQRFRGRDAVTNFKLPEAENEETEAESIFLNSHSKAEIVDMLRKHTYKDELEQSRRNRVLSGNGNKYVRGDAATMRARELLFEKAVTPSDVGKLNRLVIPKQHAEKHFPVQSGATSKGVLLNFEDANGRVWRFRYSYWNSSQSYVLTKGWSRFVKEKNLRAGDVVCFMRSTGPDRQLYIESKPKNGGPDQTGRPVQMVRIFGVNIFKVGGGGGNGGGGAVGVDSNSVGGGCNTGKRMREVELLSMECNKKQMVIGAL